MSKKQRIWLIVTVSAVLVAGGGYLAYRRVAAAQSQQEPQVQTATVYRGDIVLSAQGRGALLPGREMNLTFGTSGPVAEVLVQVGDQVQAGDVLARLDTTELERAVAQAEINLREAQIALESARQPADEATLRQAEHAVDQAAASLQEARLNLEDVLGSAVLNEDLQSAQYRLQDAEATYARSLREYQEGRISDTMMNRATEAYLAAQRYLERTQREGQIQLEAARHTLARAQQAYQEAVDNLEELRAGPDALTIESLRLKVQAAEMDLNIAQENLARAVLTAPFDGIVTAVAVQAGDTLGSTNVAVSLGDMDPPVLQFWIEETDLSFAAVGNPVQIVFEALPDLTFSGQVIRVEPTLVTVDNTTAVQLWASVEASTQPVTLFAGMNAEVEIVGAEARGALLVPAEALRELSPGQYAVFVVGADGQLELRPVQVGLQDDVNAQILSGVEEGEVVSLREAQTTSSVQVPQVEMPGGGILMPPLGEGRP